VGAIVRFSVQNFVLFNNGRQMAQHDWRIIETEYPSLIGPAVQMVCRPVGVVRGPLRPLTDAQKATPRTGWLIRQRYGRIGTRPKRVSARVAFLRFVDWWRPTSTTLFVPPNRG